MVLPKASGFRTLFRSQTARISRNTVKPQLLQRASKRGYASGGGHEPKKASSDVPWLIGAVAVTLPTCAYLLQPSEDKGHGHGHAHDNKHGGEEHADNKHEESEESEEKAEGDEEEGSEQDSGHEGEEQNEERKEDQGEAKAEESEEKSESQDAPKEDSQSDDSGSDDGDNAHTPDTAGAEDLKKTSKNDEAHVTEKGGNVEGVRFKGATSGGTEEGEQGDTRKHIPDAKGGAKKRIESHYGNRQGVSPDDASSDEDGRDRAASSKPAKSMNETSGKQEGLSNTDTKHSTDITNNKDKSRKGEGMPETAKSKGAVDPSRPQPEMEHNVEKS
ncbi:MAG: hypothetical protein M1827_006215 [Pycnora praestabilis]|nr:MAG: hypothetical protein M1827_006215 [Pycnora praestabilis]